MFVSKFYEMDPALDELLFSGDMLKDGMIVLLEGSLMRADIDSDRDSRYERARALEVNRWCAVSNVVIQKRYAYDEMGRVLGEISPLVQFVGTYSDGTKRKRSYDASYAWLVRKESMGDADA